MPRLPDAASLPRAVPQNRGGIVQVPTSPVGAALQGLGETVGKIGEGIQAREDQFDYAQAKTQFLVGKAQLEQAFKTDTDWQTIPARYNAEIAKLQAQATGIIRNPRQRQLFTLEAQSQAAMGALDIQDVARGKEVDQGRATTIANLEALHQTALSNPNTPAAAAAISTAQTLLQSAQERGYFKPEERVLRSQAFVESYGKGAMAVMAERDGNQAVADLLARSLGISPKTVPAGNIKTAILGQESGNNPNAPPSVDGALGPGQIRPATFARYAKPGEVITNAADNRAVSGRIVDDYSSRPGWNTARVAVAYFSGEGNVAPAGSSTPWVRNTQDGNGKTVSSYVSDILGRLGQGSVTAQAGTGVSNTGTPADFIPVEDRAVLHREYQNRADSELSVARHDVAQQHDNDVAFVRGGGDPASIQATPDRMRGLFPQAEVDNAAAELARAKSYADARREIALAPQSRVNEILAGHIPTGPVNYRAIATDAAALQQAAHERQAAIQSDAAAYVAQNDPQANGALQNALAGKPGGWERAITTMDATYDRMQVPQIYRNVIPKPVALQIAGQIASGDGSTISANIDRLRTSMTARTWDRFYGDLVKVGKLDTVGQLAAEISPSNSRAKAAFGVVARLDPKAFDTLIPDKAVRQSIREAVAASLEDFRASVETPYNGASGAQMYLSRVDAATRMAMQYYASGQIPNESMAAQTAANDLVNWAYDYTDGWRAPKAGNGQSRVDDVQAYLSRMQAQLTPADIGFTQADRQLAGTAIGEGTIRDHLFEAEKVWRNTRDDGGLQWFYAGTGEPVLNKSGQPVIVPFDKVPIGSASQPFEIRTGGVR